MDILISIIQLTDWILSIKLSAKIYEGVDDCSCFPTFITMIPKSQKFSYICIQFKFYFK